ncbi:unnamed protein product [Cylindrotheca closterium]|uniref:Uncharacterized protein n=1 Tax=Cylindrotheca closterium TaxID=2856 RepID=A0AAD2CUJ8_9STRA|nr:unnamed protein product [Cylindrotheca closterium]
MNKNADKEVPSSSNNGFEETAFCSSSHCDDDVESSSWSSSSNNAHLNDDDDDDDVEEPTSFIKNVEDSNSKATTNHAVCSPSSSSSSSQYQNDRQRQRRRRRHQVKPQTPREHWCCCSCCCGGYDDDDDDDDYLADDDDRNGHNKEDDYTLDHDDDDASPLCVTRVLRYCRLLPPSPRLKEGPIHKNIRFLLWWTILLDWIVALIACLSFTQWMTCCGEPILDMPGMMNNNNNNNNNNNEIMQIFLYSYVGIVLVQIIPVVREGSCIPWNLMNPIVGFVVGFVLFFNDKPMTALIIWILQISSVALQFVTYRHYSILHRESKRRLERAKAQLLERPKNRHGYQQNKRERVRRELQRRCTKSLYRLRKHLIGVSINIVLAIATLLLIVYVARKGGMCVKDGGTPSLFLFNDEEMECSIHDPSKGTTRYETCDSDSGESECYVPFF